MENKTTKTIMVAALHNHFCWHKKGLWSNNDCVQNRLLSLYQRPKYHLLARNNLMSLDDFLCMRRWCWWTPPGTKPPILFITCSPSISVQHLTQHGRTFFYIYRLLRIRRVSNIKIILINAFQINNTAASSEEEAARRSPAEGGKITFT